MVDNQKSAAQILAEERAALEEKMAAATESGEPQEALIAGKKVIVRDKGHAGRTITPLEVIESVF